MKSCQFPVSSFQSTYVCELVVAACDSQASHWSLVTDN
jgi:hypothetical protein